MSQYTLWNPTLCSIPTAYRFFLFSASNMSAQSLSHHLLLFPVKSPHVQQSPVGLVVSIFEASLHISAIALSRIISSCNDARSVFPSSVAIFTLGYVYLLIGISTIALSVSLRVLYLCFGIATYI